MKTTFYMVRHGQTILNQEHRIQGWSDGPLTQLGIEQALSAKEKLKDVQFDYAVCSTSNRAIETLRFIYEGNFETYDDLREYYFGKIDGEIETKDLLPYSTDSIGFENVGGESRFNGQKRYQACLEKIAQAHPNESIVLVSHGQILCDFFRSIDEEMAKSKEERWDQVPNGSVTIVSYDGSFKVEKQPY